MLVHSGNIDAFNEVYERYWKKLYGYVYNRMKSHEVAFDLTQDFFVSFWKRREAIQLQTSLSSYMFGSVRKQMLMHMRTDAQKQKYFTEFNSFRENLIDNSNEESMALNDLEGAVERSLSGLPKRCQEIFILSRKENKSIKEISEELNLSHKTVENQLSTAIKHLRLSLRNFMILLMILWP